ncbi:MAG TPA: alpha/beta fold hydrolase [Streptosporangiaceae bacterium]|nr:alpha/beta fold hydrolase [Streptosporangiaceae bacterium]
MRNPWLHHYHSTPAARVRLVCLPHAGGGASSYRSWAPLLPDAVELVAIQYPGREDRFTDPLVDDMAELTDRIAAALHTLPPRPYALFGHSMGSAVAYELAHHARATGRPEPVRLLSSGRRAPAEAVGGCVHLGDDQALCAELVRLGGSSAEVLADPELRRMVLTYVRNDYRLIERYRPASRPPLTCPVTVFAGRDDPEFTVAQAAGWARVTTGRTDALSFPGGHFYLAAQRDHLVAAILRRLAPTLDITSWPSTP